MSSAILAAITLGLALMLFYYLLNPAHERKFKRGRKAKRRKAKHKPEVALAGKDGLYAAIAAAIHLYGEELHDVENAVLTINKVSRTYSPWSSKIHGLNTYFSKR
ncbi:MAG: hypothetical protein FWE99_02825 [Bacteroidales bacterium]|nr:hypothetical protein [Bacteroidales bacterium]